MGIKVGDFLVYATEKKGVRGTIRGNLPRKLVRLHFFHIFNSLSAVWGRRRARGKGTKL